MIPNPESPTTGLVVGSEWGSDPNSARPFPRSGRKSLRTSESRPLAPNRTGHAEAGSAQGRLLNWLFVDLNSYFASVRAGGAARAARPAGGRGAHDGRYHLLHRGQLRGQSLRREDRNHCCRRQTHVPGDRAGGGPPRALHRIPSPRCGSRGELRAGDGRLLHRRDGLPADGPRTGRFVRRWTWASASKQTIRERVGPMLRSSVGLATNRYLAKVASDMEKPDGLVALPLDILPEALHRLTLRDLPGIGARTEKRLNEKGIHTMDDLLALDCEQAGEIWGSVWGERLWHWLRGEDFEMAELEHQKSISHSHVLAPEMRTAEKAWAVAHKLLHKAAMRLRAAGPVGQQHRPGHRLCGAAQREHAREPLRRARARLAQRDQAERVPGQPDADRRAAPAVGFAARGRAVRPSVFHRRATEQPGSRPAAHAGAL